MKHLILLMLLLPAIAHADLFGETGLHVRSQVGALDDEHVIEDGRPVTYRLWRKYDVNFTKNPYASLAIGYRWRLRPDVELSFILRHESSIATGQDKGINEAGFTLRWGDQ